MSSSSHYSNVSLKEDEEGKEISLPEDIYSLLFMANWRAQGFIFAVLIFLFQFGFILLLVIDLIVSQEAFEMMFTLGGSLLVRIIQFLAIIAAVATHEDLIS